MLIYLRNMWHSVNRVEEGATVRRPSGRLVVIIDD